ncbi:MAG: PepSY domain-containing protein [Candidatus Woesearchaeota archaeon]
MISLHDALEALKSDSVFTNWQKENPDSYLCHCMQMFGDEDAWHIGYYNKDDSITSFAVSSAEVLKENHEEVFKEPDKKVLALDMNAVELTATKALDVAKEFSQKEYPKDVISKNIIILQNISEGQVYNVTFVTLSMSTVNVKVNAETGDVVAHKKTSLMDFKEDVI